MGNKIATDTATKLVGDKIKGEIKIRLLKKL